MQSAAQRPVAWALATGETGEAGEEVTPESAPPERERELRIAELLQIADHLRVAWTLLGSTLGGAAAALFIAHGVFAATATAMMHERIMRRVLDCMVFGVNEL